MDRKVYYEKIGPLLLKACAVPLVKEKREIDTREVSFEDMWDMLGKENFTGYLTAISSEYRWYTFVISGHIRFSAFLGKGVTIRGKESLLSMKSKWNNPPLSISVFKTTAKALLAYYGIFSGLKIFDGINPETIGLDRVFNKLSEEKFTGPAIFDSRDNKIIFLWHNGNIIHIFPGHNVELLVDENTLKEVMLSPFLNITAIKSYNMSLDIPYKNMLYTKRSLEMNNLFRCSQEKLKEFIGKRLIGLIAIDTKIKLVKRHPFYQDLIQIKDGELQMEPKVMDKGVSSDFDDIIKEIIGVYLGRASEDAGNYLVKKAFDECKTKGATSEKNS